MQMTALQLLGNTVLVTQELTPELLASSLTYLYLDTYLLLTNLRYGVLNVDGVRNAMTSVPINRPNDKEKQDRSVAKAILEKLGLEKEKYRLGYTKVKLTLFFKMKCTTNVVASSEPLLKCLKAVLNVSFCICPLSPASLSP